MAEVRRTNRRWRSSPLVSSACGGLPLLKRATAPAVKRRMPFGSVRSSKSRAGRSEGASILTGGVETAKNTIVRPWGVGPLPVYFAANCVAADIRPAGAVAADSKVVGR
jgi:hypothetical protein